MFNQVPSRPKMARCSSDTKNGPVTFRKPSGKCGWPFQFSWAPTSTPAPFGVVTLREAKRVLCTNASHGRPKTNPGGQGPGNQMAQGLARCPPPARTRAQGPFVQTNDQIIRQGCATPQGYASSTSLRYSTRPRYSTRLDHSGRLLELLFFFLF